MENTIRSNNLIASDLNGTLTTGSPILAVASWVKQHQPDHYPAGFITRIYLSYLQVKLGLTAIDDWGEINMRRVLNLIASPTPEILERIMLAVARDELWNKRRQVPVEILQEHNRNGAQIFIISATYQPAVQKFASLIGRERTEGIGTPTFIEQGKVKLADKITSRDYKLKKLREKIGAAQVDLALGDTFADIPLMEEAKNAIAVYPDRLLRETALASNWRVIS